MSDGPFAVKFLVSLQTEDFSCFCETKRPHRLSLNQTVIWT